MVIVSAYITDRFDWLFKRTSLSPSVPPSNEMAMTILPVDNVLFEPSMGVLFDDANLASLIPPRFLGIESGKEDPRHSGALGEYEKIQRLYEHAGYPERTQFLSFDGGHEISVETVLSFLETWAETNFTAKE